MRHLFPKSSELFHKIAEKGARKTDSFILEDLTAVLKLIEASTMGHASEDDFEGLFEDLDFGSSKLGKTESLKNELIAKVLAHLDKIDFRLTTIGNRFSMPCASLSPSRLPPSRSRQFIKVPVARSPGRTHGPGIRQKKTHGPLRP